jgi:RNA polymerase sigma-70 factor (sigma-E family)
MDREPAFSAYVAARRPKLFRSACLLCGDPHRAEDIVQDALARLYANWPRVTRADNVEGYVRRILVNSHYSDRRRPWRREAAAAPVELPVEPGLAPEDVDAIWAAIRSLPPGQRKVVVLRHIWDRSVEETAADLGIGPGTIVAHACLESLEDGVGRMWGHRCRHCGHPRGVCERAAAAKPPQIARAARFLIQQPILNNTTSTPSSGEPEARSRDAHAACGVEGYPIHSRPNGRPWDDLRPRTRA